MRHEPLPPLQTLTLQDYAPFAHCCGPVCTSRESFVPVSGTLEAGKVYGLLSEFGEGAWAIATCLGGRGEPYQADGGILWNGQPVTDDALAARACFVSEQPEEYRRAWRCPTLRRRIEQALHESGLPFSAEQVRSLFHLTTERFDRRMDWIGSEIWRASVAIGFAGGKDVFCWPWMYGQFKVYLRVAQETGILDLLRQHGKLALIPSADERLLRDCCDHVIRLRSPEEDGPAIAME